MESSNLLEFWKNSVWISYCEGTVSSFPQILNEHFSKKKKQWDLHMRLIRVKSVNTAVSYSGKPDIYT